MDRVLGRSRHYEEIRVLFLSILRSLYWRSQRIEEPNPSSTTLDELWQALDKVVEITLRFWESTIRSVSDNSMKNRTQWRTFRVFSWHDICVIWRTSQCWFLSTKIDTSGTIHAWIAVCGVEWLTEIRSVRRHHLIRGQSIFVYSNYSWMKDSDPHNWHQSRHTLNTPRRQKKTQYRLWSFIERSQIDSYHPTRNRLFFLFSQGLQLDHIKRIETFSEDLVRDTHGPKHTLNRAYGWIFQTDKDDAKTAHVRKSLRRAKHGLRAHVERWFAVISFRCLSPVRHILDEDWINKWDWKKKGARRFGGSSNSMRNYV